jgi:hypothetical protein
MRRRWLALLVGLGLVGCRSKAGGDDAVILEYGAEVVLRSQFDEHVKGLESQGGVVDLETRRALLQPFLEEQVLAIEARRLGLLKPGATQTDRDAAVSALLARQTALIEITDAEVAAYFEAHRSEFAARETVSLHQILVATEKDALAAGLKLRKNPRDFESLARAVSRGPEAPTGGAMGRFARGQLPPEIEAVAFSLPVGQVSPVVSSPLGFHLLRVDAREPPHERTLADVRGEVGSRLFRARAEEKVRQFIDGLLAHARVNHEAALAPPIP